MEHISPLVWIPGSAPGPSDRLGRELAPDERLSFVYRGHGARRGRTPPGLQTAGLGLRLPVQIVVSRYQVRPAVFVRLFFCGYGGRTGNCAKVAATPTLKHLRPHAHTVGVSREEEILRRSQSPSWGRSRRRTRWCVIQTAHRPRLNRLAPISTLVGSRQAVHRLNRVRWGCTPLRARFLPTRRPGPPRLGFLGWVANRRGAHGPFFGRRYARNLFPAISLRFCGQLKFPSHHVSTGCRPSRAPAVLCSARSAMTPSAAQQLDGMAPWGEKQLNLGAAE